MNKTDAELTEWSAGVLGVRLIFIDGLVSDKELPPYITVSEKGHYCLYTKESLTRASRIGGSMGISFTPLTSIHWALEVADKAVEIGIIKGWAISSVRISNNKEFKKVAKHLKIWTEETEYDDIAAEPCFSKELDTYPACADQIIRTLHAIEEEKRDG